jgi:hypothetical protein
MKGDFLRTIRRGIGGSLRNPTAVIQLIAGVILLTLFVATLVEWIHSHNRLSVEVPLLLIGVCAILLIVLRTTHAFAISVAVLIIGTVVAGDRFMLAVTALLKGNTPESMKFVTDLYVTAASATKPPDPQDLALRITAISRDANSPDEARKEVTKVLAEAQARSLIAQIRSASPNATTPLERLIEGGDRWQSFVSTFKSSDGFKSDMNLLRRLQIVIFPEEKYEDARLTEIGQQLRPYLRSARVAPDRLPAGPDISNPNDSRVVSLDLGKRKLLSFTTTSRVFARFHVEQEDRYVIETSDEGLGITDTVIILKDSSGKKIAQDDDGGEGLCSKLNEQLKKGDYLIEVQNFDEIRGEFYLTVSHGSKVATPTPSPGK